MIDGNGHEANGDSKAPKRKGKPRGNPTKLTTAFINRVEQLAAKGLNQTQIAEVLDVGQSTMSIWKTKDTALSEKYIKALNKGAARGLEKRLDKIEKHEKKSWQAAAWWAERRFPEQWGKRDHVRLSNPDGSAIQSSTTVIAPTVVFVQPSKEGNLIGNGNGHATEI